MKLKLCCRQIACIIVVYKLIINVVYQNIILIESALLKKIILTILLFSKLFSFSLIRYYFYYNFKLIKTIILSPLISIRKNYFC